MSKIDLHIVSFNVPFPADYGGVIDVYHKLKALSDLGIRVALHCFDYGRGEQPKLNEVAAEVHYYPRDVNKLIAVFSSPFTVKSRISKELLVRLAADDAPILFESLQSCLYLDHPSLADKRKWVRAHNVEHDYYRSLAKYESAGVRKIYYLKEAVALEKFESVLEHADGVLAISTKDTNYFKEIGLTAHYLPAFYNRFEFNEKAVIEIDEVALYHGNLQVEENVEAVLFLLEVFKELPFRLIIAGNKPGFSISKAARALSNVQVMESPSDEQLFDLIHSSKLNCLPTFQATGIKLKLLHALCSGNQVLVNSEMVEGTDLGQFCEMASSVQNWREVITQMMNNELDLSKIANRREQVKALFNNQQNAMQLAEWLGLAQ